MKILTYLICALLTVLLTTIFFIGKFTAYKYDEAVLDLIHNKQVVEKRISDMENEIENSLKSVGDIISRNRDFSMKVLVEHDLQASEVVDIAKEYINLSGLTLLDVIDSSGLILSSGHFPAGAGGTVKSEFLKPIKEGVFVEENIKGNKELTWRFKSDFTCVDQTFFCVGGIIASKEFVDLLTPRKGVKVLLKYGDEVIGMDDIKTISLIKDNKIFINDISYLSTSIEYPVINSNNKIEILILTDMPKKVSIKDVL